MSDEEEESMSEGFSASEEEWKPGKDARGGESSDDDDSDFEDSLLVGSGGSSVGAGASTSLAAARKKGEPKSRSASKTASTKKRKPLGQSLRAKLYNKYRPPPKTFTSSSRGGGGSNSPSASTSRTASKNAKTPNESSEQHENDNSSSDSSVEDYLVNPADLDFRSSFFNVDGNGSAAISKETSPAPIFDCNAGLVDQSDSGSEDNNESSVEGNTKAFDFRNLLEKANSLERAKETIAKRAAETKTRAKNSSKHNTTTMDVNSLLALGEKQNHSPNQLEMDEKEEEKDERNMELVAHGPQKLSKTKSTRIKRHTKTRPASTVVAGDTDDSDWEEVADGADTSRPKDYNENLEIHVDLPSRQRHTGNKKQMDLEMAIKRKLNRDLKERQLLLHQTSLLCNFGRCYFYNRLLNDTELMHAALKLLPSKNVYPPERGTEIKYFQSLVTWFKTVIKLLSPNLYPEKTARKKSRVKRELLEQIKRKEARCKQDMIFIFVILMRAMGLQCRLVVNMQPLPLRPAKSDLLTVKLKSKAQAMKAIVEEIDKKNIEVKEQKEEAKVEMEKVEKKVPSKEKNKHNKEGAVQIEEKESLHEKRTTREKGKSNENATSTNFVKNLEKEQRLGKKLSQNEKEYELKNKLEEEKRKMIEIKSSNEEMGKLKTKVQTPPKSNKVQSDEDKLKNKLEVEKRKIIAMKSINEEMGKLKTKVQTPPKSNKVQSDEDKPSSSRDKSAQKRTLPANIPPKDNQLNEEEDEEAHVNPRTKLSLSKLKRTQTEDSSSSIALKKQTKLMKQPSLSVEFTPVAKRTRHAPTDENTCTTTNVQNNNRPVVEEGIPVLPKTVIQRGKNLKSNVVAAAAAAKKEKIFINVPRDTRSRSRSKSPKAHISPTFLLTETYKEKFPVELLATDKQTKEKRINKKSPSNDKVKISTDFLQKSTETTTETTTTSTVRVLRSRQIKSNEKTTKLNIPQLDGADNDIPEEMLRKSKRRSKLQKLHKSSSYSKEECDEDFEPTPPKKPKQAPLLPKEKNVSAKNRKVLSTDDDDSDAGKNLRYKVTAGDMWIELWSDVEEDWICVDLFKGKLHSVETIRKSASLSLAYVFAFQNDSTLKDVTARYCSHWAQTMQKSRADKAWLETAISNYLGHRTARDIREDQELRRIHEQKPMPKAICDYKNHPLYVLERHLYQFQAIYPPDAPTLGFVRGEPVYPRDCVYTLHSREIWLKSARTVKLGEQPYKIVLRPKWDSLTRTILKQQPLEIFGFWQTQDYEPPIAENGLVPRNAYGNVELFKECMLPKKTVHLKLPGLNRVCKKLNIDCANVVVGFDCHNGFCHPIYDGFVVCEEFGAQVTAAWYEEQAEQDRKEQEKIETRVYGNWKKLIRGLLIRERLKKKYNF